MLPCSMLSQRTVTKIPRELREQIKSMLKNASD